MVLILALLVILALGAWIVSLRDRNNAMALLADVEAKIADDIMELHEEAEVRNKWLDYLFRTFSLHIPNPYVIRPTFEEKRCYHCHYPEYAGHDPECVWLVCRPITSTLYPPPDPPAVKSTPDGNTILPVFDTDTVEPPKFDHVLKG